MLSFGEQEFTSSFWRTKLNGALLLRDELGLINNSETSAYRIFNAEGDGVPGLVIDRYGDNAVVEIHSQGVWNDREIIGQSLKELVTLKEIVFRSAGSFRGGAEEILPMEVPFIENGLKFRADIVSGQKTGFFLDQRENRKLVRSFASGKRVLNAFAYSGGFSVNALIGGASFVHSVELSKVALLRIEEHLRLNCCLTNHQSFAADCFKFLEVGDQNYDLIILDPPSFAKHRAAKSAALRGYEALNALGFKRAANNSFLFTFSCSLFVSREEFREAVYHAATQVGRTVQVISELQAGADHPVNIYHREGEYLKGLLLRIE